MPGRRLLSAFLLDGRLFGVEVEKVQEVIRDQHLTRVPLAPPLIRGLMNLRGQIVLAIDLRVRLGMPPPPPDRSHMNIILRTDGGLVSFVVDEVADVIEVSESEFELPRRTLRGAGAGVILGAYKLPDGLLVALDVEKAARMDLSPGGAAIPEERDLTGMGQEEPLGGKACGHS